MHPNRSRIPTSLLKLLIKKNHKLPWQIQWINSPSSSDSISQQHLNSWSLPLLKTHPSLGFRDKTLLVASTSTEPPLLAPIPWLRSPNSVGDLNSLLALYTRIHISSPNLIYTHTKSGTQQAPQIKHDANGILGFLFLCPSHTKQMENSSILSHLR